MMSPGLFSNSAAGQGSLLVPVRCAVETEPSSGQAEMRVLHVYSGNLYGGVESFLRTLAQHRVETPAVSAEFALCFDGRLGRELRTVGATVHLLGEVRVRAPLSVFAARQALRRVLRVAHFDVVVCHSSWPYALFAPIVRESALPLVYYMHDVPNARAWPDVWAANQKAPEMVIANSFFTSAASSWLFRSTPRTILRYPVSLEMDSASLERRDQVRASLGTPLNAVVILQASRMQPWKGQRLFLQALAKLTTNVPWACWIAGGAQRSSEVAYERELHGMVASLGLDSRVKFLGQRDDIPALMRAADLFCQPNVGPEPFGIVFIEALAAGLPVVATSMGGALEIVSESSGRVVPPEPEALAVALQALIEGADMRAALSMAAPARARDLCNVTDRMQDLAVALARVTHPAAPKSALTNGSVSRGRTDDRVPVTHIERSPSVERLNVLHIHSGNLWGGVEKYLRTVAAHGTHAPSVHMEFALCFEGRIARELRDVGAPLYMLGPVRVRFPQTVALARRTLEERLQAKHYNVVVCHSAWSYSLFARLVRRSGSRLVYHMHDVPDPRSWLDRWASLTPPDLVLCYTAFVASAGRWIFPTVSRKAVLPPVEFEPNGLGDRIHVRASHRVAPDQVVIINAARMQSWKGQHLLIEALARLRANPRWLCWIAGGAQRPSEVGYERELRALVEGLDLAERVTFLGQRDDVPALMAAADIHCQPNVAPEPFGQVYVEALLAGLPVVATNMGGCRDIINETCGILVPPEAEAVASALNQLINGEDQRLAFSAAGKLRGRALCDPATRMAEVALVLESVHNATRAAHVPAGQP